MSEFCLIHFFKILYSSYFFNSVFQNNSLFLFLFSLVAGNGGYSRAAVLGLLFAVASLAALAAEHVLSGAWVVVCEPPGSRAQAQ